MKIQTVEHLDAAISQLQLLRAELLKEVTHPEVPSSSVLAKHQSGDKVWDIKPGTRRLVAKFDYQPLEGEVFNTPEVLFQKDDESIYDFIQECAKIANTTFINKRTLIDLQIGFQKDSPVLSTIAPANEKIALTLDARIDMARLKGNPVDLAEWTDSPEDQRDLHVMLDGFDIPRYK